jgi:hypothetical protein
MSITVKPKVGHMKVKNSIQALIHVERITNEIQTNYRVFTKSSGINK